MIGRMMSEIEQVLQEAKKLHHMRAPLRKAIRSAIKRADKKLLKLQDEVAECAKAEEYLQCGEIIKANLKLVTRGASEAVLPDMYNPGQERCIQLEEHLKPLDNAKKYFKRQRKLQKGEEILRGQIEICKEHIANLDELSTAYQQWEEEVAGAEDAPDEEIVTRATKLKIHVPGLEPPRTYGKKKEELPKGVRRFISKDKMTIYVGKNARDNDYLSTRIANGNDWWFHVSAVQGSHVVVRTAGKINGNEPLPQETFLDAAHLALYFSKSRKATTADIHYCQAKNVRKSKKSPAGQVNINNGKNFYLRVEEARLKRLLNAASEVSESNS